MITDNDKKILDAFYEPVPMGRNDDAVLRKVMNAVKAAAPELFELRAENEKLRNALEFYGWEEHWVKQHYERSVIEDDRGRRARTALKGE